MARKILTTLDLIAPLTLSGAAGTSGQVLISGGSGVIPSWSNIATTYGLTVGTSGLKMTTGTSPWTGSAAATIDIDTAKVALLTGSAFTGNVSYAASTKIIGDFDNATLLSRTLITTSTTNATTGVYVVPNGTATAASVQATNAADPTNASKILIATNGSTDVQLVSGRNGTGTYLPLSFYTSGVQKMQLDASGNLGLGMTSFGSGVGVLGLVNATAPSGNPVGGGIVYVDTGALKYRGTSGAAATIVNADGTTPYLTAYGYVGQTQTTSSGTNMAITGITSITGATGTTDIAFNSAATTSAASGAVNVITGTTTTSGTTGAVTVRSGNSAAASGAVTISTGTSSLATSGTLTLSTGNASGTGGVSGAISIATGTAGSIGNSGSITMDVGNKTTGTFGTITIGGTYASSVTIGNVTNTATATIAASTTLNLNVPTIATNVTAGTLALFNTGLTGTLNFVGAATAVNIGASTGTLTLNNPTISTSVTSGTLALFNTGLTGTLNVGGAAGTISIGDSTTTKAINIGTSTTGVNSSVVRIGSAVSGVTSNIFIQGAAYIGKAVSGTGNQTGYNPYILGSSVTVTGTTGNATAGNMYVLAPDAILSNASNVTGNATAGSLYLDAGNPQFNAGSPINGNVLVGTLYAGTVTIGRSGTPMILPVGPTPSVATPIVATGSQQFGMIGASDETIQVATTKTTGAGPGFGIVYAPMSVFSLANSSTASSSTTTSVFASANDVLSSLEPAKLYRFKAVYYSSFTYVPSNSGTISILFGFSNAPQAIKYNFKTYSQTAGTTVTQLGAGSAITAVTIVPSQSANGTWVTEIEGYFTSHATLASTLTPQFTCSAAPGSGTVMQAGSWFEVHKIGSSTQTHIAGNWA
jgi:hypothetical protein